MNSTMRRKKQLITESVAIESIIDKASVCRLAMSVNDQPYIVPLNFGYKDKVLYFHCATKGLKLEYIKANSKVCFQMDINKKIIMSEKACKWGMNYLSVIGFGKAFIVENQEEKSCALDIIMKHYSNEKFTYLKKELDRIVVVKVEIDEMSGKTSDD